MTPDPQPSAPRDETASRLLEAIFETTGLLIAYLDRDLRFVRVNRAYAQADGATPEAFVGKRHFALYPDAENEAIFARVLETGEPHLAHAKPFEYARNPERGVTYWDWTVQPVRDLDGAVVGLLLTLADVTGRERAVRALRESEARHRTLFEHAPVALWHEDLSAVKRELDELELGPEALRAHLLANPDEVARLASLVRIKDVNQATLTLYGAPDKGAFRADLRQFSVPETYAVMREQLVALAAGRLSMQHEARTRTLSGEVRTVLLGLIVFEPARDTWADVLISLLDITDRRRAADERERLVEELQATLGKVRMLSGLLPICASCKGIRDDRGYWSRVEEYLAEHADVTFTHGLCPACFDRLYPE